MNMNATIMDIKELVANNDLEGALNYLRNLLQNPMISDEIILQLSRLSEINKKERLGILDNNQVILERNKVRVAILETVNKIDNKVIYAAQLNEKEIELEEGNKNSTLNIEDIKALKDVVITVKQEKTSASVKRMESQEGKININIDQK